MYRPRFHDVQTVKKPMNFTRMRERLRAGEYDSRRAGLNSFMEDVDWMRHNCIKFNGVSEGQRETFSQMGDVVLENRRNTAVHR